MDKVKINIVIPKALLERLDAAARDSYSSRSDYIRQAVIAALSQQQPATTTAVVEKQKSLDEIVDQLKADVTSAGQHFATRANR